MNPISVLVADDHEVVRKGIVRILETHPEFEVVGEVCNGVAAVAEAHRLEPQLIVMDIMMPELNGLEATRQIKRNLRNTSVLIFSMYHSEQLIREVLMCGARGYVLKSDPVQELISALIALSQGRPFFTASVTEIVLDDFLKSGKTRWTENGDAGRLTNREREIVQLIAEGNSNKKIATKLSIGVSTVETHRGHIMQKLKLDSVGSLVRYAIRNKLVDC